jgi:cobalt/nickel transport system permease protein
MHLPEIDKYAHLDSPLHRWDARFKVVSLTLLLLAVVLSPSYPAAAAGLTLALGLAALSRIPVSFVFVHLQWVLLFCLFLMVVLPLTAGGEALWGSGPLGVSRAGLRQAGLISLRATAGVLVIFAMAATSRFHVTLKALRRLHVPQSVVQILAFSYRYIFVVFDELARMRTAAVARGARSATWLRRLHLTGSMVGMLLVRSFERTDRVYHAMRARGYRGEVRTLDDFEWTLVDIDKSIATAVLTAALVVLGILT